jgi:hypothetical protein
MVIGRQLLLFNRERVLCKKVTAIYKNILNHGNNTTFAAETIAVKWCGSNG